MSENCHADAITEIAEAWRETAGRICSRRCRRPRRPSRNRSGIAESFRSASRSFGSAVGNGLRPAASSERTVLRPFAANGGLFEQNAGRLNRAVNRAFDGPGAALCRPWMKPVAGDGVSFG